MTVEINASKPFYDVDPRLIELVRLKGQDIYAAAGIPDAEIPEESVKAHIADCCSGLLVTVADSVQATPAMFATKDGLIDKFAAACLFRMPVRSEHEREAATLFHHAFKKFASSESHILPRTKVTADLDGNLYITGQMHVPVEAPSGWVRAKAINLSDLKKS